MLYFEKEILLSLLVGLVCIIACPYQQWHHCPIDASVLQTFGLYECVPQHHQQIKAQQQQQHQHGGRGYLLLRKDDCPSSYVCARYTMNESAFVLTSTPLLDRPLNVNECEARIEEDCGDSWNCSIYWKRQSLPARLRSNKCDFNSWLLKRQNQAVVSEGGVKKCNTELDFHENNLLKILNCTSGSDSKLVHPEMTFNCLEMMNDGDNETVFLLQTASPTPDLMTMRYNNKDEQAHLSEYVSSLDDNPFQPQYCSSFCPFPQYYNGELALFEPTKVLQYKFFNMHMARKGKTPIEIQTIQPPETIPTPETTPKTTQKLIPTKPSTIAPTSTTTLQQHSFSCHFFQVLLSDKNECVTSWQKVITTIIIVLFILLLILLASFFLLIFGRRDKNQQRCQDTRRFRCLVSHVKC